MRIAYLDCFSGISGDMMMGALVDAGVPASLLEETVAALGLGARLEITRVSRSGISATKVDVWAGDEKDMPREQYWREHGHAHEHGHEHHHHEHNAGATDDHVARPLSAAAVKKHPHAHRGLKDIREIISAARISDCAKRNAIAAFEALAAAEAKIHNTTVDDVHFHEVGAVDAIVDVVCAMVGAEALGVDEWVCSPLNLGGGTVECAHGTFPIPAPASVELLKGAPVYSSGIQSELVTPTGAAIARTLATRFSSLPAMTMDKAGYGAGSRDFAGYPNVLRIVVGEEQPAASLPASETITVLAANLDDLSPQVFGYVMDKLLAEGALDVFSTPVQMKKSRPGTLLTVLCRPEDAERLARVMFTETSTLGVRRREERRQALLRRTVSVETRWGAVRMKVANLNGTVANYAPEYEDCRRIAGERGVPLKQVMQEAVRAYLEALK